MRVVCLLLLAIVIGCDQQAVQRKMIQDSAVLMDQIEDQVAADAVRQYEIVRRNSDGSQNSEIQLHVQAGLVAAAYLQAEDEQNYRNWNAIAEQHGKNAGMP